MDNTNVIFERTLTEEIIIMSLPTNKTQKKCTLTRSYSTPSLPPFKKPSNNKPYFLYGYLFGEYPTGVKYLHFDDPRVPDYLNNKGMNENKNGKILMPVPTSSQQKIYGIYTLSITCSLSTFLQNNQERFEIINRSIAGFLKSEGFWDVSIFKLRINDL